MTEADILEFDLDSKPIDPRDRKFYNERFIHGEIYKARPDVMAVVHNHAPAVVPFSCTSRADASRSSTCPLHRPGRAELGHTRRPEGLGHAGAHAQLGQSLAKKLGKYPRC